MTPGAFLYEKLFIYPACVFCSVLFVETWFYQYSQLDNDYFFCPVSSWGGENDNTDLYSLKNNRDVERNQDDWDEEYDAGKVKRVKNKQQWREDEEDPNQVKVNSFQKLQDLRYHIKVCSLHFTSLPICVFLLFIDKMYT